MKMRRCFTDPHYWKNPALRRSREKMKSIHKQLGCCSEVPISADALRMRCRRLCERKPSGKFNISEDVSKQYKDAGEGRETLEMALLECLAKWGTSRTTYKKVKARQVLKSIKIHQEGNGERDTDTSWIMMVYSYIYFFHA